MPPYSLPTIRAVNKHSSRVQMNKMRFRLNTKFLHASSTNSISLTTSGNEREMPLHISSIPSCNCYTRSSMTPPRNRTRNSQLNYFLFPAKFNHHPTPHSKRNPPRHFANPLKPIYHSRRNSNEP